MIDRKSYLEHVPVDGFFNIIPKRRKIIEAAKDEFPRYEYNANVLAKAYHPAIQHVIVSDVRDMSDAKVYTLVPDTDAGTTTLAPFRAGQYVSVSLHIGESVLTRPYSLCGSPADALAGTYAIAVKSVENGFAADYIHGNWKKGVKLDISGPAGLFYYEGLRDEKTVIGIAAGSGIAPFLSMARAIAAGTEDFSLTLLYSSRRADGILFREELDALTAGCDKIKVAYVLTRERREGYENGYITADLIRKYAPENGNYSVFVCGPQRLYDAVRNETDKLGLNRRRVRFDAYGEYRLSDRDADAVRDTKDKTFRATVVTSDGEAHTIDARGDEPLLVAFERAGLNAPAKCRSGECGWCRARLVSGDVYAPELTERRREYDRTAGYIHPCCAFPTSDCTVSINYEAPEIRRSVKDMRRKNRVMSFTMSALMSAVMGVVASYLVLKTNAQAAAVTPAPVMYASNIVLSVILGLVSAAFLPFAKWGRTLADKARAKPPGFRFTVLNALPLSAGNTVFISLILSFPGVFMARRGAPAEALAHMPPLLAMWLGSWAKLLLPTLLVSYALSVPLSPAVSDIAGLSAAGAEVGRASAKDTSVQAKRKKTET